MLRRAIKNIAKSDIIERLLKADSRSFNALLKVLKKELKNTSDEVLQGILVTTIDTLRRTENIDEAVSFLQKYSATIPETAKAMIAPKIADLTEKLYKVGVYSAETGPSLAFGLKDLDAMEIIGKQNLFWIGNHYDGETKARFDGLLKDFFETGYSRKDFAVKVREEMQPWMEEEATYWEGLGDHIATKTKELGRVAGYERAGIEYVKVQAILDDRTSHICRCMHGRIISVNRLREQADNIMSASTKGEMKAAQAWIPSFSGKTSDLPSGVAGPPYHYKCRTTTVAYFESLDNVGDNYQYFDGEKTRKEKVLFQYHDKKIGREFMVTDSLLKHTKDDHPEITESKVKAALRSITKFGENADPALKGQLVTTSENGVFLAYRDNVVYTAFMPPDPKAYFKRASIGGIRKWVEKLKFLFAPAGLIR